MSTLLIHGASGNAACFASLLTLWNDAVAIDLPGRGSEPGPPLASVADTAAWLIDRLRQADAPAVLVGHSYGGAVALQVALDAPERVRGLVMVSSGGRLRVHPLILEAVARSTVDEPYRLDGAFGPGTPAVVIETYAGYTALTPPATALADWRACDGFDALGRLGEVRVPTLVVHGDKDALTVPKHQVALAAAIPGAQRVEIPDAGHMLPWERPGALVEVVEGWSAALG